jgi:hypothetical protein
MTDQRRRNGLSISSSGQSMPDLTGLAALAALSQAVWLPLVVADAMLRPSAKPPPPPSFEPPPAGGELAAKLPRQDSKLFSVPDPILTAPPTTASDSERAFRVSQPRDPYTSIAARHPTPYRELRKPPPPPPLPSQNEAVPSPFDSIDEVKRPSREFLQAEGVVQRPFSEPSTARAAEPALTTDSPPAVPPAPAATAAAEQTTTIPQGPDSKPL